MLYWLLYLKLFHYFPPFRIFRYLTFRTAFASLTALFTALIIGPLVINRLREFQKKVRKEVADSALADQFIQAAQTIIDKAKAQEKQSE